MKAFIKSAPFWIGTITGMALALVIGIVDYGMKFDGLCMDCDNDFGFPLKIYQSGSFMHSTQILWLALFGNIVIFGLLSICFGLLFHLFWNNKLLK